MIAPRLDDRAVLTAARVRSTTEVGIADPRIVGTDIADGPCLWLLAMLGETYPHSPRFAMVEWPDRSLGYAVLYEDEARRNEELIRTYRGAREALERSELDSFDRSDAAKPQ